MPLFACASFLFVIIFECTKEGSCVRKTQAKCHVLLLQVLQLTCILGS